MVITENKERNLPKYAVISLSGNVHLQ